MITLWYLGSLETINKIADRFGIGEASVIDCRNSVILSILKYLKQKFIRWPNQQEMQTEAQAFAQRNGFQDMVGAVNGTRIKIHKSFVGRWLLTPFRDIGHLTPQEKKFNTHHSSNRVVIIRAFALLKDRFSRLKFINTILQRKQVLEHMWLCLYKTLCSLIFCLLFKLFCDACQIIKYALYQFPLP